MMKNNYLILYPTCQVVKGAARSVICDIEKNNFHYIPNDLVDVMEHLRDNDYTGFLSSLEETERTTIEEYKDFLLDNDLAFFTQQTALFPALNLQYHSNSRITNSIIDIDRSSTYNVFQALDELDANNCRHLQIRIFDAYELEKLDRILEHIHGKEILSVEVYYKYNEDSLPDLENLVEKWPKIKLLLIHSAPVSKVFVLNKNMVYTSNMGNFVCTEEVISSAQNCGCIAVSYFTVNLSCFTESVNFNSCLNSKLSIDVNGKIKNCPSMKHDYGTLGSTAFDEVLKDQNYSSYGRITKDQIEVCKDCEHRHFCTDCRAFVDDIYAKPKKCNYDPYTAQWN